MPNEPSPQISITSGVDQFEIRKHVEEKERGPFYTSYTSLPYQRVNT